MIEHSIKIMYIAVSGLLLVIALTSFYSHEKKFMQFFIIQDEARRQSSWLEETDSEKHAQLEFYQLSNVQAFQKATDYSSYVFTGREIKAQVYGILLYRSKKLNQDQGIHMPTSLDQLMKSEEILAIDMIVLCDGVVVTQQNARAIFSGIEEAALYGLRYTMKDSIIEIMPIY